MNYIRHLNGFFIRMSEDQRMTSLHISLYMALFQVWNLNRFQNPFTIVRDEMMQLSRIGSVNTYARCIKQLQEWGYILYVPASNMYVSSRVTCISFDTASDTGRNTASDTTRNTGTDTGTDTGSDTGTDTGTDTASYYINNTNNTNFNKQDTIKNLNNGRGKKPSGIQQIRFGNDKDYSEPL